MFPFGARGVRFVVGLPVFLYASGRSFAGVGGFLAVWKADRGGAPVAIALAEPDSPGAEPVLIAAAGPARFGLPFAVNSALRSCRYPAARSSAAGRVDDGCACLVSLPIADIGRRIECDRGIKGGWIREPTPAQRCGALQACPAWPDRSAGSTPTLATARRHLPSWSRPNTSSASASTLSQPLFWISLSSWPGAQPA